VSRDYELGFILSPEVSEDEIRSVLDRIEQIVANYGGQTVKVNQWGRRRLAYPIERHRDGFYVFIDMILTPESVAELERMLKVSEIVLRHMMKRRDPKAVQKEREERVEREARAAAAAAEAEATAAAQAAAAAAQQAEAGSAEVVESTESAPVASSEPEAEAEQPAAPSAEVESAAPAAEASETIEA
jgi:small subunit ribosomal protein S6